MHAGMRRVPAERARHAKRLGHVQLGAAFPVVHPGAGDGNGTTAQQGVSTIPSQAIPSLSAVQSLASTLTSSSTTPPSASSAATSSTSSDVFSTGTHSFSTPLLVSSTISPSAISTSTSPTASTSPPHSNSAAAKHNGLPGGAIAGIIAGAVVVGTALIVFIVRKTYLRRRERKRISWSAAPGLGTSVPDEPKAFSDISERPANFTSTTGRSQMITPLSPFETHGRFTHTAPVSPLAHMQTPTTYATPAPPSATYNNPAPVISYSAHSVPFTYNPGSPAPLAMARAATGSGPSRAPHAPVEAIVKCTFMPTLPDELSIMMGERVFVVEQYDDGWDLCVNARGERGMVPRECLEHARGDQPDINWRNTRRMSSLNPDGQRF